MHVDPHERGNERLEPTFSDLPSPPREPGAFRFVAHELNALLDGSMRRLRLVRRGLVEPPSTGTPVPDVQDHLDAAESALTRMTELLQRTMAAVDEASEPGRRQGLAPARLFSRHVTLQRAVAETVESLAPVALDHGVDVAVSVDPDVGGLQAGPLVSVLHNGLQNAIEASATCDGGERRVELQALSCGDDLLLHVVDTGPGVGADPGKPRGHGLGLNLSRLIIEELHGSLELSSIPFGRGAVLAVRIPSARLRHA